MHVGRIVNINSTKYIVDVDNKMLDCTIRGKFRINNITPLVGDFVEVNEDTKQVVGILPRRNFLQRPNIANIDIALIVTSVKRPDLDLTLLDKLLVNVIGINITPVICFTKVDLLDNLEEFYKIKEYYERIGITTIINTELDKFDKIASGKVIALCGQTGAGKSSFINEIDKDLKLATNPISDALNRGIHTTRYVSLYKEKDYFIADTPGFSALDLNDFDKIQIRDAFIEFANYECKYRDCMHINTDGCQIIENVGNEILLSRYENYKKFIKEKDESSSKLFKK